MILEVDMPHDKRLIPPLTPITQTHQIDHIDFDMFAEILVTRGGDKDLLGMLNYIQKKLQPNLGLSRTAREAFEAIAPLKVTLYLDKVCEEKQLRQGIAEIKIAHDSDSTPQLRFELNTKFRTVSICIHADFKVTASLLLNWDAIYEDLRSEAAEEPLRGFTAWQRFSESSFFVSRSVNQILTKIERVLPECLKYNTSTFFLDHKPLDISINDSPIVQLTDASVNFNLVLDTEHFEVSQSYKKLPHDRQAILVLVEMDSPLMGTTRKLSPASLDSNGKLHIPLFGYFNQCRIVEIFHVDHNSERLIDWILTAPIVLKGMPVTEKHSLQELALLKNSDKSAFAEHLSTAPMVRGSDPQARRYWASFFANDEHKKRPVIYTEMITPAHMMLSELYNESDSADDITNRILYGPNSESSFRRFVITVKELELCKQFVFQITVPHTLTSKVDEAFFWGADGEHIGRTSILSAALCFKLVPPKYHKKLRLAVNMCCPAASVEEIGGGFGLRNHPHHLENIAKAFKNKFPTLPIEFKTLLPSHADKGGDKLASDLTHFSQAASMHLAERVVRTKADRLVVQGKARNREDYLYPASVATLSPFAPKMKGGYSGSVVTMTNEDLKQIGYISGGIHTSVEHVLSLVKSTSGEAHSFEVMLGRVLLGSTWVLLGNYASDSEIMLHTILNALIVREATLGGGRFGLEMMKIAVFYQIRHLTSFKEYADIIIAQIGTADSQDKLIEILYDAYKSYQITSIREGYTSNKTKLVVNTHERGMVAFLKEAVETASGRYPLSHSESRLAGIVRSVLTVLKAKARFKQLLKAKSSVPVEEPELDDLEPDGDDRQSQADVWEIPSIPSGD